MDLTKEFPRSPNDMLAGIVSLPRMIDKTQADAEGTLGEYDVDCPHDKPVLPSSGSTFPAFAAKLKELKYDTKAVEGGRSRWSTSHTPGRDRGLQRFRAAHGLRMTIHRDTSISSGPRWLRTGPT